MNYNKYDIIYCKRCFYLLINNDLSCIDQENQITNNNKYNEYNYNPAAITFQCIFASLLFTVTL